MSEAARLCGMGTARLRKMIRDGRVKALELGGRKLVDLDEVEPLADDARGARVRDVVEATGLTDSAVRRGCAEGWLPHRRSGNTLLFDLEEVERCLRARMK